MLWLVWFGLALFDGLGGDDKRRLKGASAMRRKMGRHAACSLDLRRRGTGSRAHAPGTRFRNRWL